MLALMYAQKLDVSYLYVITSDKYFFEFFSIVKIQALNKTMLTGLIQSIRQLI